MKKHTSRVVVFIFMIWHVCNSNHINVSNPTCCFLLNIVTHYIYFSNVVTHYINFSNVVTHYINFSIVVTHSVRVHDVFQRFYVFCLNIATHYIYFSNVVIHYIIFSIVVTHFVWFLSLNVCGNRLEKTPFFLYIYTDTYIQVALLIGPSYGPIIKATQQSFMYSARIPVYMPKLGNHFSKNHG